MSFPFLSILNSLQSSLTIYIMPSSSACYVTSQHHPSHPPGPHTMYIYCIITELGRVKEELSEIFLINWQCSNIMQYLNNEYGKYLEDACLDLKIRKHVYMWVWVHVHCKEYAYMGESTEVEFLEEIQTEVLRVFLLAIHRHLFTDCTSPPSVFWTWDFYKQQLGGGGGGFWVNKFMDQWRVS